MSANENRNIIVVIVALLASAFLVAGYIESTILLSYVAVFLILSMFSVAAIESNNSELDLWPYWGVILSLGILLLLGMTGIWLTWDPEATSYNYILGLPTPTAIFLCFLWFLPFFVVIYYALGPFDEAINDEVIDSIMNDARDAQAKSDFPLAPDNDSKRGDD